MLATILADMAVGKTGGAEIFFLIAAILCGVGAIVAYMAKALWGTAVAAAWCLGFIAWILL